jgi:hypothetical protein
LYSFGNKTIQAGAELCQAQVKLGLTKLYLLVKKCHLPCVHLPFRKIIKVVFHLQKIEVVFLLQHKSVLNWGCLPFTKKLRSCSIYKKWGPLPFKKKWGRIPFTKKVKVFFHLQKSWGCFTIYKKVEVVFYLQKKEVVFH